MIEQFTSSILWAQNVLQHYKYQILGEPQIIRTMPWSTVISFQTLKEMLYLKLMAKEFTYEASLLEFLHQHNFTDLPNIIATNNADGSFVMKYAGTPLRQSLTKSYDISIVCNTLKSYAKLQINCIPHITSLIKVGVSDWRLGKLTNLYKQFLLKEEFLLSDGLTPNEIHTLRHLSDNFETLCNKLSNLGIPETLEHGDFHDANILLNKEKTTIADFGDSTISHPFFSIALFLYSSKYRYNLNEADKTYITLRDSYLQEWQSYTTKDNLLEALKIATILRPFMWSLNLSRIYSCTGPEGYPEYHSHISINLRRLMNNISSNPL